ncbi:winged helix-turn-helix domain-containing protein [Sphingomonas bacterium]|uniref:winged helix-turn-helix domain-containing protein n=1 Tax=Sphingomonas bacterium TaxID=1895847 RepID=UPI00157757F5|nr:LysR family transcriptional regulator [Sphingomonas bacterium]
MRAGALKLKAQLLCGDALAMGPGKAALLEAIDAAGSISAGARSLGMSYRRAWLLVDEMNRCFADRLVDTVSGGGTGRGATLSVTGRAVLTAFRAIERRMMAAAEGEAYDSLRELLRDTPQPAEDR